MISQEEHQAYLDAHLAFCHYRVSFDEIKEAYFAETYHGLPLCHTRYPAVVCDCGHFDLTWADYHAILKCKHGHAPCFDTPGIDKAIREEYWRMKGM